MTFLYSPTTRGFYDVNDRALYEASGTWPGDGIEVTDEGRRGLQEAEAAGKRIVPDEQGRPIAVDPLPPTLDQILAVNTAKRDELMTAATARIGPLQDAQDLGMETEEEAAMLVAWRQYRVALSRVDLTAPVWPEAPT